MKTSIAKLGFAALPVIIFLISTGSGTLTARAIEAGGPLNLKSVNVLPLMLKDQRGQILTISGEYGGATQHASIRLDGGELGSCELKSGPLDLQLNIPAVTSESQSTLTVETSDGTVLATASILRKPVRELTIYVTPHSHVDIGYTELQPAIETKQVSNLISALELIEQTKNNPLGSQYRWTVEAAWTLDNLQRDRPDMIAALQRAVLSKQVELDGAFGNLLTGLCRPEELMRSYAWGAQYGRRLGVPVETAMISDVPGYTWGTITALAEAGIRYFSIGPNQFDRIGGTLVEWQDRPFYWRTPDGRRKVLCWTSYRGYAWSMVIKQLSEEHITVYLNHLDEIGYAYDLSYLRWSGHSDNAVPDAQLIDTVRQWNDRYEWPKLKIAVVSEPFKLLEECYADKIPTFSGDWTPYWEDGAASSALETAMNRATAERLVAAETLWAMLRASKEFPAGDFREAWRGTMLYSEHTWGAHCSISEPENPLTTGQWDYKRGYAVAAHERATDLIERALDVDAPVADAVDVFNTTSWPRTQVVTVSKTLSSAGDRVCDVHGAPVASQRLASGELAFLAAEIPAMSYRRFVIAAGKPHTAGDAKASSSGIENAILAVQLDPRTGNIRQLVQKGDGHNLVVDGSPGLNEYLYVKGHNFDQPDAVSMPPEIAVRDSGPLVASLVIESDAPGCRKLTREIKLVAGADHVELVNLVDKLRAEVAPASAGGSPQDPNNGKEAVHIAFPFNVPNGEIRMDVPWAVVRPEADQLPGSCKNWFTVQRWVDVSNDQRGVTWSSLDAPLVQVGGITATLFGPQTNSSAWRTHVEPSQSLYSWAMNNYWYTNYRAYQEGPTVFRYAIRPHGEYSAADAQRFGIERSQPLIVAAARKRSPLVPPRLELNTKDVVVTAFKPADDGDGYVVRLFAAGGNDVKLPLVWSGEQPKVIYRSDSLESKTEKIDSPVLIPAWGVVTLRVEYPSPK